eukprot:g81427.t1
MADDGLDDILNEALDDFDKPSAVETSQAPPPTSASTPAPSTSSEHKTGKSILAEPTPEEQEKMMEQLIGALGLDEEKFKQFAEEFAKQQGMPSLFSPLPSKTTPPASESDTSSSQSSIPASTSSKKGKGKKKTSSNTEAEKATDSKTKKGSTKRKKGKKSKEKQDGQNGSVEEVSASSATSTESSASAKSVESAGTFAKSMQEAMKMLGQQNGPGLGAQGAPLPGMEGMEDFEKMMEGLMNGMDMNNPESFDKVVEGLMSQMISKEHLYEPVVKMIEKYPTWLEENKDKITPEQSKNYNLQLVAFKEIRVELDKGDGTDKEKVLQLMQKMQEYGEPPADIQESLFPPEMKNMPGMGGVPGAPASRWSPGAGMGMPPPPGMPSADGSFPSSFEDFLKEIQKEGGLPKEGDPGCPTQ